jgi:DNA (cytosine-5)-methyltransferase 1
MKILNLYCGIGGNRTLWGDEHHIVAVENNPEIARVYKEKFPNDEVIVADAHQFLLDNFDQFDFIWSSPPCPTHSRMRLNHKKKVFPDMKLYQEIILLKHSFKGKFVIENVIPYYEPLIKPSVKIQRHCFWSNFKIDEMKLNGCNVGKATKETLSEHHNIPIPECKNQRLLLRNCVYPPLGLHILKSTTLFD